MTLPLPSLPAPVLRKRSRALNLEQVKSGAYDRLFDDLHETMIAANGIGIAAVQCAKLLRVFFVKTDTYDGVFVNPRIDSMSEQTEEAEEGCLSIPGKWGMVPRALRVKVTAYDRRGRLFTLKASGLLAKVLQHESDHLDGKMILDRAAALYDREPGYKPKR